MELFGGHIPLEPPEQQEAQRVRQRNRIAKRASRARQRLHKLQNVDIDCSASSTSQDVVSSMEVGVRMAQTGSPCDKEYASTPNGMNETPHPDGPELGFWCGTSGSTLVDSDWSEFGDSSTVPVSYGIELDMDMSKSQQICVPIQQAPKDGEQIVPTVASPDNHSSASSTLLHIAVRNGTTSIIMSLLKAGAEVNSRDPSGTTPLHLAVQLRRANILEALIDHGANINMRNSANMTPLELAVRARDEKSVNILLSNGADLS